MTPWVSILTPTLDCAAHLPETLASLEAQQHDCPPFEQLFVDGGSRDETASVARRFSPHGQWIDAAGTNIYEAMNLGLSRARGAWIGWLNADDLFAASALSSVWSTAQAHPDAEVIVGDYTMFRSHAGHETVSLYRTDGHELERIRTGRMRRWFDIWVNPMAVFYRRDVLARMGDWSTKYKIVGDWELWFRAANQLPAVRVHHTGTVLGHFRMHDGSLSAGTRPERLFREKMAVMASWMNNPDALPGVRATARRMYRHDALSLALIEARSLPWHARPGRVLDAVHHASTVGARSWMDLASALPTALHEVLEPVPVLGSCARFLWTHSGGPVTSR